MHIAIFGAQGHLGRSLTERLNAIKPAGVTIAGTTDRAHNKELAAACDLAVVAVRPKDVGPLLTEIRGTLKANAQILSFAAGVALADIETAGHAAARAMADPWWNFAGFVFGPAFSTDGLEFMFEKLARRIISLENEATLDDFTAYFVHAYIVLFLRRLGELENSNAHLAYLAVPLRSSVVELVNATPEGDPNTLLATLATPGGVTESILFAIRADKDISPAAAHAVGIERIRKLK